MTRLWLQHALRYRQQVIKFVERDDDSKRFTLVVNTEVDVVDDEEWPEECANMRSVCAAAAHAPSEPTVALCRAF